MWYKLMSARKKSQNSKIKITYFLAIANNCEIIREGHCHSVQHLIGQIWAVQEESWALLVCFPEREMHCHIDKLIMLQTNSPEKAKLWIEDSYFSQKQRFEVQNILMVDLFLTNTQLLASQDINWWTGVVWIIVMFLSAVWTLILTAPIHCRL